MLYRLIGESVWFLQHLEKSLTAFVAIKKLQKVRKKGTNFDEQVAYAELEKQQKKTLGPLIKSAKNETIINENLIKRFEIFLEERNWLIHKCVINEFLSLRNINDRSKLFSRIKLFSQEAIDLNTEICNLLTTWFQSNGYNINKAKMMPV